ncbi:ABC transporter ATP-binding protein [Cutibacterium acnes JCM 18918]|nr:ABC transporter ATP-binding protein [Cutibacterium acnes JCM 18918]
MAAFCTQALLYVLAVVITHFADLKLRSVLQGRIIGRLSRAPLAWFSSSSTGQVRKAIQDDTVQVHALVAHAPVEQTAAIGIPVVLLVYAFVVDWRLGLLCLATFPIYALLQWWSMRGMTAKTAEMNDKLANISANAIELTEASTSSRTSVRQARPTDASPLPARSSPGFTGTGAARSSSVRPIAVGDLGACAHGDQPRLRSTHGQGRLGGCRRCSHLLPYRPRAAAHRRGAWKHGVDVPASWWCSVASAGGPVYRADRRAWYQLRDSRGHDGHL